MSEYYNRQWRLPNNENKDKQSNYSMDFDGSQAIDTGFVPKDNITSAFTFSAWVKKTHHTDSMIFGTSDYISPYSNFIFGITRVSTNYYYYYNLGGRPPNSAWQTSYNSYQISNFSQNTWHHLVFIYDGNNIKLYGNGNLEHTTSSMTIDNYPPHSAGFNGNSYIGGVNDVRYGLFQAFTGQIDAVSIFNYALSSSQVTTLYGSSSTGIGNPMSISPKPVFYAPLGDQDAFNGSNYLVPNSSLKDYVFNVSYRLSYIDTGLTSNMNIVDFTFSTWFNSTDSNTYYLGGTTYGISGTRKVYFALQQQSSGTFRLFVTSNNGSGDRWTLSTSSGTDYSDGNWHHIVGTWNNTTEVIKLYVDNVDVGTTSYYPSASPQQTDSSLGFGDSVFRIGAISGANGIIGKQSNVQIFNTALPETGSNSIATLYNNGSPLTSMSGYSSLVGWWKLDASETYDSSTGNWSITDHSSNSNTGTSSGMTQANLVQSDLSFTSGYSSYALDFDGTNDYIDFGAGINISGDASFSFWLYRESTAPSNEGGIITIAPSGATTDYISIALWADKIQAVVSNSSSSNRTSTQTISKGSWHHIVVVKSSTAITSIYINGSSETLATGGDWYGTIVQQGTLMKAQYGSSFYTSGKLSNVSIWNTALTQAQVTEIYSEGVPQNLNNHSAYSNLVSWWQLGSNSSFNSSLNQWTCIDEKGTNTGVSSQTFNENAIVDGVGSYANGLSSGMGGDEVIGDAPYSTANALSVNMDIADRTTDVPS